ncbi:heme peroxidase [Collybia nuda]|uniref:Heme peroxidase n=1 Tax=Collybia nuda TaxID=64659 RepID=A0A9P5YCL8_9AGAR|nr:heme peroxidase [Collybia nuda]
MSIIRSFAQSIDLYIASRAPLDTDGEKLPRRHFEETVSDIHDLVHKRAFELSDLPAYIDALKNANGVGLDDRELLLEKVLVLMSRLENLPLSMKFQKAVITLLYDDLPHPPSSYVRTIQSNPPVPTPLAQDVDYAFRSADGSNYNPSFPTMGMAGTPYARSVPATRSIPKHVLPEPGLVFDTLLRREKEFTPHPDGVSSLFFAFADLVIHSIFHTRHGDAMINDTSSYLDLSILYGDSESQQNKVRKNDGTGRLHNDVFSDRRLLYMPPASGALLVLLSRNHNYIAEKLLDINENGTFSNPPPTNPVNRKKQDDEIFHRTRLVNCGYFMQIILGDYVGVILGLARDGSDWRLEPLMNVREPDHEVLPRGAGNVVSVEFNLLYRWHSTLSQQDAAWTDGLFKKLLNGKEPSKVTKEDFRDAAHEHFIPRGDDDVKKWTFGGLARDTSGRFKDDDLAEIIQNATENIAGAFQARGIPESLRIVEILAMEQAREWGTCSLNEFRKFLGLRPYKTFKEWNSDEKIHKAAAGLYKDIDNLELHVGLQAEEAKNPGPGAGLCPGYTISRAILADAVVLSRGDRFMTTEMTPHNFTSWGYNDCQYDKKDGSFGGLLTKLLFRTLPDHYPTGSAYAHFPFLVPESMKKQAAINTKISKAYIWTRPAKPSRTITVNKYDDVKQVLSEKRFLSGYDERLLKISRQAVVDEEEAAFFVGRERLSVGKRNVELLLPLSEHHDGTWANYFVEEALSLIKEKSFLHAGDHQTKYVDIVRDVINLLPVHWISEQILGLPLKTITNPHGAWYEQEVYTMFADVGRYVFMNLDPADDWHLRESATECFAKVDGFVQPHLRSNGSGLSITDSLHHQGIETYHSHAFLRQAQAANKDAKKSELSAFAFAAVVPTAAHFSQAIAHIVDFFLDDDKRQAREDIVRLAALPHDKDAIAKIMGYAREALRINPPVSGVYRTAGELVDVGGVRVEAGERLFASVVDANLDTTEFGPNPTSPSYSRRVEKAGILGLGEHGLLSSKFFESTVPQVLGTILGLKDISRGPDLSGNFASFTEKLHGSPMQLYINAEAQVTPFPESLIIQVWVTPTFTKPALTVLSV